MGQVLGRLEWNDGEPRPQDLVVDAPLAEKLSASTAFSWVLDDFGADLANEFLVDCAHKLSF